LANSTHTAVRMNLAQKLCHEFISTFPNVILSFIVYGSVAIGKAKETSDIDIQIISDNPAYLLNKKSEELLFKAQKQSGIKIVLNVKSPSFIIEELSKGDSFHVLMALNGVCLLKSALFDNLQTLVQDVPLPSRETIEEKIRLEIKTWSEQLIKQRLISFLSDNSLSIFQYLAFKRVSENEFKTWNEQEGAIQRASNHTSHVNELIPQYAGCINKFLDTNKNITTLDLKLDAKNEFNLIELLKAARHISHETKSVL